MDEGLVPIARFIDWSEAHIACGFLKTNGIGAVLHDTNLISIDWPLATALGGIKLMVPKTESGAALGLLREVGAGEFVNSVEMLEKPEAGEDFAIERCPQCSGEDIFRPRSFVAALIGWAIAAPTPLATQQRHCRRCGHEWKALSEGAA